MALIHRRKILHSITASSQHLTQLYSAFSRMCEEQTHTDMTLVTNDGKAFGVHKMVLVSCSPTIKALLLSHCPGCLCEKPTVHLPDFPSSVVKSLLCLLYMGRCEGECRVDDLKALARVLNIKLENLTEESEGFESGFEGNDVVVVSDCTSLNKVEEEDDEMLEVTPEVHDFLGNHFLADGGQDDAMSREEENDVGDHQHPETSDSFSAEAKDGFLCRLCGRTTPSPASLFSHLLYPHYSHLWRSDVPQRKQTYTCTRCSYGTKNRQRYIMHVARVHDELREKLKEQGENLEVLDNTSTKSVNTAYTRIVSKIAKMPSSAEADENDSEQSVNVSFLGAAYDPPPSHHGTTTSKPKLVRCRLCGSWKRRENFFTHMVSVHFRYLWADSVATHSSSYSCEVVACEYKTKYRYNLLFHLAGKHKQLKSKLLQEGIADAVLEPLEPNDPEQENFVTMKIHHFKVGGKKAVVKRGAKTKLPQPASGKIVSRSKPPAGTKKLICKMCEKVSFNHASHRLHVVSKHFQKFWSTLAPDASGIFHCHHDGCEYSSNNRQVFVIHVAFVHSELKLELDKRGDDITLGEPLGKRNGASPEEVGRRDVTRGRPSSVVNAGNREQTDPSSIGVCKFCNKHFDGYAMLIKHIALTHFNHLWDGDTDSDENPYAVLFNGPYECSMCGEQFGTDERHNYILHKVMNHDILKSVLGKECQLVASNGKSAEGDNGSPAAGNLEDD